MPEAAPLALVRRDIDRSANKLKRVLMEPGIRKEVLGGVPKDETKAIKAFVSQNRENALKTKPKVRVIILVPSIFLQTYFFLSFSASNCE